MLLNARNEINILKQASWGGLREANWEAQRCSRYLAVKNLEWDAHSSWSPAEIVRYTTYKSIMLAAAEKYDMRMRKLMTMKYNLEKKKSDAWSIVRRLENEEDNMKNLEFETYVKKEPWMRIWNERLNA